MNEKFKDILISIKPEIFDDPECDLLDAGIIDSFDIMAIISKCEEFFEIDFEPDDILPENFASPGAIWKLLEKYMKGKE
jgi:acyl carrier protein